MISDRYWRRRFGGDPAGAAHGRCASRASRYAIVGVMPAVLPSFPTASVDIWWPYPVDRTQPTAANRQLQWYTGIGRLRPGVTLEQARADLARRPGPAGQGVSRHPTRGSASASRPTRTTVVGECAVRCGCCSEPCRCCCSSPARISPRCCCRAPAQREQEVAVRFALGASRTVVFWQLLTETALLAFVGAAGGLLVAIDASSAIGALAPELPRSRRSASTAGCSPTRWRRRWSWRCSAACCRRCAPAPGRRPGSTERPNAGLGPARRAVAAGRRAGRALGHAARRRGGAVAQRRRPGARRSGFRSCARAGVPRQRQLERGQRIAPSSCSASRGRSTQLRALPGVESAATSWSLPGVPRQYQIEIQLIEGRAESEPRLAAEWRTVSPGYFDTLRIPLVAGDMCRFPRTGQPAPEVMVNRSFAERYFNGRSVLGLHLNWEAASQSGRIVGVVGGRTRAWHRPRPAPTVYACDSAPSPFPWFLVRTRGEPLALAGPVRSPAQGAGAAAVGLRRRAARAANRRRVCAEPAADGAAGAVWRHGAGPGVPRACTATLSHAVSLRRREVGLRLALGAPRGRVIGELVGQALRVVSLACFGGLILARSREPGPAPACCTRSQHRIRTRSPAS